MCVLTAAGSRCVLMWLEIMSLPGFYNDSEVTYSRLSYCYYKRKKASLKISKYIYESVISWALTETINEGRIISECY